MEDEINLHEIFDVLWKNRVLIIGISMAAILVAVVISFIMPITYTTSGIVGLGNIGDEIYASQPAAVELMLSDEFLIDVFKGLNITPENKFREFKKSIKISPVKNTESLLKISVNSKSKQEGIQIINEIIQQFSNLSKEDYAKQMNLLSDQLAFVNANINLLDADLNNTRTAIKNAQSQGTISGESPQQAEMRFSRMIEYLQIEENRHQSLSEKYLDLKKQSVEARQLVVVQEPREPLVPAEVQRILMVAVAGMFGLIIGIILAFLRK